MYKASKFYQVMCIKIFILPCFCIEQDRCYVWTYKNNNIIIITTEESLALCIVCVDITTYYKEYVHIQFENFMGRFVWNADLLA